MNAEIWDVAFIGKHVWGVATKQISVWRRSYLPSSETSWYWRKIYAIKEKLKLVFS